MLRLITVALLLLQSTTVYAAVERDTLMSSLPPPSLSKVVTKEIVICDNANLALTFYWTAVEEGLDMALTYYTSYFLYGECSRVSADISRFIWEDCVDLSRDECGMMPVTLSNGSKKFGALVGE